MNIQSQISGIEQQIQNLNLEKQKLQQQQQSKGTENGSVSTSGIQASTNNLLKHYQLTELKEIIDAEDSGKGLVGKLIRVGGWVRKGRTAGGGTFAFLEINDGSTFENLQVKVDDTLKKMQELDDEQFDKLLKKIKQTGCAVIVEGTLAETPEGVEQAVELNAMQFIHIGTSNGKVYPIAKKKLTMEFLREVAHLRGRTQTMQSVMSIRHQLSLATHLFFNQHGFKYLHTPIITSSDTEGAGEMFQVTTLLSEIEKNKDVKQVSQQELQQIDASVKQQGEILRDIKAKAKVDKELQKDVNKEVQKLKALKEEYEQAKQSSLVIGGLKRTENGEIDYVEDFFQKKAFLTVSGQLQGEYYACGQGRIYTFGPTFRAENSHTARHLAEFWMIEPEIAFCSLEDLMLVAEQYVQFCSKHLLAQCRKELDFLGSRSQQSKDCIERLQFVADKPFARVSYTEGISKLEEAVKSGVQFENPVEWGIDLAREHECYLCEQVYKQPVILYNYPKAIKAFYMKNNEDGKTVQAMDVLVPKVGELMGGSAREDKYKVIKDRIKELGMDPAEYSGYLDLRRFGSVPHAGFGVGFERLIMYATGIENIRDTIPFPRWSKNASDFSIIPEDKDEDLE